MGFAALSPPYALRPVYNAHGALTHRPRRTSGEPRLPDILTIALCLSVGCAVAWLLALYTARGERRLLSDTALAMAGAAACALAFAWASPTVRLVTLATLGPLCGLLAIKAADAARRWLRPD